MRREFPSTEVLSESFQMASLGNQTSKELLKLSAQNTPERSGREHPVCSGGDRKLAFEFQSFNSKFQ